MMTKTSLTVSDPVSGTVNPKSIPGSQVQYTLTATNEGPGSVDSNSLTITDPMPANTALCVADPCAVGIDAIVFADTPPLSGLSYVFARDVSFSADGGVTYTYVPAPDAEGFDGNITTVRINPQGEFASASGGTNPTFSLLMKVRVDQ